jgi:hypothetical protein
VGFLVGRAQAALIRSAFPVEIIYETSIKPTRDAPQIQKWKNKQWKQSVRAAEPFLPLGLAGGRSAVTTLLAVAAADQPNAACLIALGLLGDVAAVATLMTCLAKADLAEPAAKALYLITGAPLDEKVFVPEKMDEDELFDEEKKKLKKGEPLTAPGGRRPGSTMVRLSQNPQQWQAWWAENAARFTPRIRHRHGKPYSPACLLASLASEHSPHQMRQLAYEELVIRHGVDFPFEADLSVARQRQVLGEIEAWVRSQASGFQEGAWSFRGQVMGERWNPEKH